MNAKLLIKIFLTIALFAMVTGCGGATPEPPAEVASDDSAPAQTPVEAPTQVPAAGFTPSSKCIVPDVVGLDIAVAESNLAGPGLQPVTDFRHDESVAENAIISQEPPAGTTLEPCQGDVVIVVSLGAVPVPTETPRPTDIPASPTPIPTETPLPPTPTIDPNAPSGQWAVRAYQADNANIILVNGHMIGVAIWDGIPGETDWIDISDMLTGENPNYLTFVNVNQSGGSAWGFSIRHNETIVWGNEGGGGGAGIAYMQTLQILPDNTVKEVNLRDFDKDLLSGSWSVRVATPPKGVGLVLVNDVPAAASDPWGASDWVDISGLLYANQDNVVTAMVWNFSGEYSWDISLRKEESIVWGNENSGSGQTGEVFFTSFIIDGEGNVVR